MVAFVTGYNAGYHVDSAGGRNLQVQAVEASHIDGGVFAQAQQGADGGYSAVRQGGAVQVRLQLCGRYGVIVLHGVFLLLQAGWLAVLIFC
ncbi:hypothetical protein D3C80_1558430 [compost metagenome]